MVEFWYLYRWKVINVLSCSFNVTLEENHSRNVSWEDCLFTALPSLKYDEQQLKIPHLMSCHMTACRPARTFLCISICSACDLQQLNQFLYIWLSPKSPTCSINQFLCTTCRISRSLNFSSVQACVHRDIKLVLMIKWK